MENNGDAQKHHRRYLYDETGSCWVHFIVSTFIIAEINNFDSRYETRIMQGALQMLRKYLPCHVVFEFIHEYVQESGVELKQIFYIMADNNYSLWSHENIDRKWVDEHIDIKHSYYHFHQNLPHC